MPTNVSKIHGRTKKYTYGRAVLGGIALVEKWYCCSKFREKLVNEQLGFVYIFSHRL